MSEIVVNLAKRKRWVRAGRSGAFDNSVKDAIYAGIRRGIADGQSNIQIAYALGISDRTVLRYRHRHGLPNFYGVARESGDSHE